MKIQIVFLSLFLATSHARHEPKGKGLRGGDDRDLELVGSTVVPNGSSATINCGSGSQCCVTGMFKTINNVGSMMTIGGGGSCRKTMSNGSLGNCESNPCSISCDGVCSVVVKAGSASAGEGGGDGGHDNDGDYGYDGDGDNDDGDGGDNDGGNGYSGYPYPGNGWDQDEGEEDDSYDSELDTIMEEE